jgi:solute carrier family 25 (mitochondrial phosphate transporter), member 3
MNFLFRFFADILLTPLEATRIRLVSERGFATGLVSGFMRIAKEGGLRELYAGFLPILCKYVQVPFSLLQDLLNFSCNDFSDKYPTQLVNSLSMNSATSL